MSNFESYFAKHLKEIIMVSIETYRARIGSFNAGKSKQSGSDSGFDPTLLNDHSQSEFLKVLRTKRKSIFLLSLLIVVLLVFCNYQKVPHGWKTRSSATNLIGNLESLSIAETVLKASVVASQLIIGNVEANPGPVDLKEFLAFLFVDAEDASVKEVLKEIKASQDNVTNLKKIKNKSVDDLKATLAYLNDWDKNDENIKSEIDSYTKEGIAHLLIKKISNMAPLKCSSCLKVSHFKPGESCVLACIRCNRGACVPCYESDKEKLQATNMFNKSIFFSCETCTMIIAQENQTAEAHRKKSCGRKKTVEFVTSTDPADSLADAVEKLSVGEGEADTITLDDSTPDDLSSSSMEETATGEESSEKVENNSIPQETKPCTFFKQNRCQFGISGKGCKFFHPKMCQKLLSHGKSSYRGCTKEDKCKFFHPPMCIYSLRKRICSNLDCQFMHIKGTKRNQPSPVKDARNILNRKKNSRTTREEIMECNNSQTKNTSPRMESSISNEKSQQQTSNDPFLEKSLTNPNPPYGNGFGGDGHQELMKVLQQMLMMQNQQLQILQHLQMPHQMTLQSQMPMMQPRMHHM